MINNYLKSAWRSLNRNRRMAALNIAGLTAGIAAAALIFLWVSNQLDFDRYQPGSDRIYILDTRVTTSDARWEGAPMRMAAAVRRDIPGIAAITRLNADNRPVIQVGDMSQYEQQCAYVDSNWFDFFSYRFVAGNAAAFRDDPRGLILTESAARRYFGDQRALGATLRVDSALFRVAAVVADPPPNSSFQYEAYLPIAALLTNPQRLQHDEYWGNGDYRTFLRLERKLDADRLQALEGSLTKTLQRGAGDDDHTLRAGLTPLVALHFDSSQTDSIFAHGDRRVVTIFSILGLLILLVACINYVNLTTAKASLRSREVSIRKIVGAARRQLFWQFTAESLLVSALSLGAALLVIRLSLPAFSRLTGEDFMGAMQTPVLWKVMGATLGAAFLLNSIYPALLLSSFNPLNIFRGITVLRMKDVYLRKGLVVVQFTVAILLVTAAVVIQRQLRYIQTTNPGYDRSQVMTVSFPNHISPNEQPADLMRKAQTIRQELLARPGIEAVSLASQSVVNDGSRTNSIDWEGKDTAFQASVGQLSADAGLQKMLGLSLKAGRWFRPGDPADGNNYILNEAAVLQFHLRLPAIGQQFSLHGVKGTIIGVVRDFHFKSMHQQTGAIVVFNDPGWWQYFYVKAAPRNAAAAVAAVQEIWKQAFPGVPLQYSFLDEQFNQMYRQDAIAATLILLFAAVAIMLSSLGLFGLAAFAAERRRREVGIRKVLGASTLDIGSLLSREFVRLVVIAVVLATPLSYWAIGNWLRGFAYRIDLSWWMFAVAGLLALFIALLITGWHALRAAWQNPVRSLRVD